MRGVFRAVGRGAAGNDVEFRAFLDDDEVVHVLPYAVPLDEETGLDRLRDFYALADADEVAAVQVLGGEPGNLVLFGVEELPVILGQAVVAAQGLLDVEDFKALLKTPAAHARMVHVQEGAAPFLPVRVDARIDKALPVRFAQGAEILYARIVSGEVVAFQIKHAIPPPRARAASVIPFPRSSAGIPDTRTCARVRGCREAAPHSRGGLHTSPARDRR